MRSWEGRFVEIARSGDDANLAKKKRRRERASDLLERAPSPSAKIFSEKNSYAVLKTMAGSDNSKSAWKIIVGHIPRIEHTR